MMKSHTEKMKTQSIFRDAFVKEKSIYTSLSFLL